MADIHLAAETIGALLLAGWVTFLGSVALGALAWVERRQWRNVDTYGAD